ncbi:hypothetical protein BH23BAC1_BH23BAC1_46410 [soil metagenome]
MNRRTFTKKSFQTAAMVGFASSLPGYTSTRPYVRIGAPLYEKYENPEEWVSALQNKGFRAAYCPVRPGASSDLVKSYEVAAKKADIVIAELWVGSNPISPDKAAAHEAFKKCVEYLAFTEAIGANCCVNLSGSKNPPDGRGPHIDNFSEETFDEIVEITRKIIDEVQPTRTYYTLEPMPSMFPDSADTYLRLIKAIDRKNFAVHMDPVNITTSPRIYLDTGAMISDFFKKLGPHIRSCHGKDVIWEENTFLPRFSECMPGQGNLNYAVYLKEISKLKDIPLMLEHLDSAEEYQAAADYVRSVGKKEGIEI